MIIPYENLKNGVAESIRFIRMEKRMTNVQLAMRTYTSPETPKGWQCGRNMPQLPMICNIAEAFHHPVPFIMQNVFERYIAYEKDGIILDGFDYALFDALQDKNQECSIEEFYKRFVAPYKEEKANSILSDCDFTLYKALSIRDPNFTEEEFDKTFAQPYKKRKEKKKMKKKDKDMCVFTDVEEAIDAAVENEKENVSDAIDTKMYKNIDPLFESINEDADIATVTEKLFNIVFGNNILTACEYLSAKTLCNALLAYLCYYCVVECQDFLNVMKLACMADIDEDDAAEKCSLDYLFEDAEKKDPNGIAWAQYSFFRLAPIETKKKAVAILGYVLTAAAAKKNA